MRDILNVYVSAEQAQLHTSGSAVSSVRRREETFLFLRRSFNSTLTISRAVKENDSDTYREFTHVNSASSRTRVF